MKILFITTYFYLISGPVGCYDVAGYDGGHVEIYCFHQNPVYFCKFKMYSKCENLIESHAQEWSRKIHPDRFTLHESPGSVAITFRNLNLQDTGAYECGETGKWRLNIYLTVNSDPCCRGNKTVTGYLGQTVTISCSYPAAFETHTKFFYKQYHDSLTRVIDTSGTGQHQEGRFSASDDKRKKVFSVSISDVRKDDGGVYSCAVWDRKDSVGYYSHFTEIHVHVTETPGGTSDARQPGISALIIVCVCGTLLLMTGGFALTYKLKCGKSRDSASDVQETQGTRTAPNITMQPIYQNTTSLTTNQSDSTYQPLNLTQPDVYLRLNPNPDPLIASSIGN